MSIRSATCLSGGIAYCRAIILRPFHYSERHSEKISVRRPMAGHLPLPKLPALKRRPGPSLPHGLGVRMALNVVAQARRASVRDACDCSVADSPEADLVHSTGRPLQLSLGTCCLPASGPAPGYRTG